MAVAGGWEVAVWVTPHMGVGGRRVTNDVDKATPMIAKRQVYNNSRLWYDVQASHIIENAKLARQTFKIGREI